MNALKYLKFRPFARHAAKNICLQSKQLTQIGVSGLTNTFKEYTDMKTILVTLLMGMGMTMAAVPMTANATGYDSCAPHSFYGHGHPGSYGYIAPHWHDSTGHDTQGSDQRYECRSHQQPSHWYGGGHDRGDHSQCSHDNYHNGHH